MPDTMSNPALLSKDATRLHAYWLGKARGAVPVRRSLDPVIEIPQLVASTFLLDRIGPRWRYRLVGTKIVRQVGRDVTGQWFDTLYGDSARFGLEWFEQMRIERRPMHFHGAANAGPARRWGAVELLYLPLSSAPDGPITQLFGGMWFPPDWKDGPLTGWRTVHASALN
ncbi:PAS domain-containing protein [Roseiterribacter gracilis]|uniref:PAS domain-containing protein n=1 Tax=Roseiterribacter gracilis TaxID=2812848 RepID=A0A8S8XA10_9PROT|nr:hypothetical protein TMPK1_11490 [Rhodospirillales bacterium TMPK1]